MGVELLSDGQTMNMQDCRFHSGLKRKMISGFLMKPPKSIYYPLKRADGVRENLIIPYALVGLHRHSY